MQTKLTQVNKILAKYKKKKHISHNMILIYARHSCVESPGLPEDRSGNPLFRPNRSASRRAGCISPDFVLLRRQADHYSSQGVKASHSSVL